jgi:hypothetical protein
MKHCRTVFLLQCLPNGAQIKHSLRLKPFYILLAFPIISSSSGMHQNSLLFVLLMVFNATFNNIAAILWRSVLLVEETWGLGENHRPVGSHWQILSHNVVSSTPRHVQAYFYLLNKLRIYGTTIITYVEEEFEDTKKGFELTTLSSTPRHVRGSNLQL